MAPITASAPWTSAMTKATTKSPERERARTTTTLAAANERLRLAAYMALTCASPEENSAAMEKPALVKALPIVTKAQSQKKRRPIID
jgi:predicted negative regulator of RcsB-dependent stress response